MSGSGHAPGDAPGHADADGHANAPAGAAHAAPAGLPAARAAHRWTAVCAGDALVDGGDGVRFNVPAPTGDALPAFVVRFAGRPRAFLNRCAHLPMELDWLPGRFFDASGLYLICATHGATYGAGDGACVDGPCRGRGLVALHAAEAGGTVWVETLANEGS